MTTTAVPLPARTAPAPARREPWLDVAKGACIVLVVLWHVVIKQYQPVDWHVGAPVSAAWGELDEHLLPLRMPLFFTVSGMLAVGAVARAWPVLLRTRVLAFTALYGLWVLMQTLLLAANPGFDTARATTPLQLLAQLTISPTNLWYLLALALYFLVARATRRVPTAALLGAALLLSVAASSGWIPNDGNRWQVLQNLVFFLGGLRLRPAVERFAKTSSGRRAAVLAGVFVAVSAAVELLRADRVPGVHAATAVVAVLAGIDLAVLATRRLPRPAAVLQRLGRRTLPVYVLHMPLLAVLAALLAAPLAAARADLVVAVAEPVVLTTAVVLLCLAGERLLRAARLGRLLDPLGVRA